MMDNELAKELKQAGFPQSVHYNERGVMDFLETDVNGKTHIVSVPTLEELVEACGLSFGRALFLRTVLGAGPPNNASDWSDTHRSSRPPLANPSRCKI